MEIRLANFQPQPKPSYGGANYCDLHSRIFIQSCKSCRYGVKARKSDVVFADVKAYLDKNPNASWKEVHENVPSHYKNWISLCGLARSRGLVKATPEKKYEGIKEILEEAHRLRKIKSRRKEIVAEKVAIARLLRKQNMPYKKIGEELGVDHTVIVYYMLHYKDKP